MVSYSHSPALQGEQHATRLLHSLAPAPWPLRLGPTLTLSTSSCHEQPPELQSAADVSAILAAGGNAPGGVIDLRFLVSETERVLRVVPGTTMPALSPPGANRLREQLHYAPGIVDGQPRPMWPGGRVAGFPPLR